MTCVLFLCALAPRVQADSAPSSDVLVGVYALQPEIESFQPVIADAINYRLSARGLAVDVQLEASLEDRKLAAQARSRGIPIALSCRISSADRRLTVTLQWQDLQKGGTPAVSEQSGSLDLNVDSVILRTIDTLVLAVDERIGQLAKARAALTPPPKAPPEAAPAAAPPAAASAARTAEPSAFVPTMRLMLITGFAPFIAIGPASYYFSVGLLPSILVSLEFSTRWGRFAIGLYAATNYFSATGATDSTDNLMIPFGPDIRYELGDGAPFLFFAHLCGGPALLLMSSASQGGLMDITGFVKTGIGATVMITARIGVSVSADYEVYFEMPYMISGFSPTALMTLVL